MRAPLKITPNLKSRLRAALREDLGRGDISSSVSFSSGMRGTAVILAKESGIVAGLPVAAEIFHLLHPKLKVIQKIKDGSRVQRGIVIASVRGNLRAILAGERLSLNFIQRLSGIATLTHAFVRRVRGTRTKILDTRKTTPLWRDLEKYAVRVGGGFNHRFSLSETIMIKDTHWEAIVEQAKGSGSNLAEILRFAQNDNGVILRRGIPRRRISRLPLIIEVHSRKQLDQALRAEPYVIMFDNRSLGELRRGVRYVREWARKNRCKRPQIEASGGVTMESIRRIARTGVDRISVGAITHSARAMDFSLKIVRTH